MINILASFDWHLGCFHILAIVNHVVRNTGVQTSVQVPAFNSFLCIPQVKLLEYMIILCFIYWGTTILFSTWAAPFDIPISHVQRSQGFQFLHILTANTSCPVLAAVVFTISILVGVKIHFILVLVCISLINAEHLIYQMYGNFIHLIFIVFT